MNTRTRQKIKAELYRKCPDVMATLKDDGKSFLKIIFIPRDKVQTYKEKYGDKIEFLIEEEPLVTAKRRMMESRKFDKADMEGETT